MAVESSVKRILDDNENPERGELLEGVAFNLGLTLDEFINTVVNQRKAPNLPAARRRLEKQFKIRGAGKVWIDAHKDKP